jgi:hypothetical protein
MLIEGGNLGARYHIEKKRSNIKWSLPVSLVALFALFIGGCSPPIVCHVLDVSGNGDVMIDVGENISKTKMKFDIYGDKEIPVARIVITQVTPDHSIGTIVNRYDGSKPEISVINRGMLCKQTTSKTLAAEGAVYKYQKKTLKRQYNLTKIKSKSEVYESLDNVVQDANEISSIKAGGIKVDKKD